MIQIHQIVMNLCINAGHAMEEKRGVLHVGLEDVILDDNMLPKKSEPGCLCKNEPFFTTKE